MDLSISSSIPRKFPDVSKELLEKLDSLYPLAMPRVTEEDRSIWIRVGQRQVIDHLRREHKNQNSSLNVIKG